MPVSVAPGCPASLGDLDVDLGYLHTSTWDEAMAVVKAAVDAVAARSGRVSLVLKADLRPGVTGALTSKVETVERYLADEG
jgi:uncharacterized protein YqgV (UPF0045/DUF77 family)